MFASAFLLLGSLPTAPPRQPTPPPSSEITVSERFIALPNLPESVAKAHAEYGTIRTGLAEGLKDLERTLRGLYACPEANIPIPASFKVARDQANELRFLASLVNQTRYEALEEPVIQAWEEWQTILRGNQLVATEQPKPITPIPAPTPSSPQKGEEKKELEHRRIGIKGLGTSKREKEFLYFQLTAGGRRKLDVEAFDLILDNRAEQAENIVISQQIATIAKRLLCPKFGLPSRNA